MLGGMDPRRAVRHMPMTEEIERYVAVVRALLREAAQ